MDREQALEWKKCATDFVYFCNHYVEIVHPTRGAVKFNLYPYQVRVFKDFESNQFSVVKKFRQAGLTTLASIWCMWLAMFRCNQKIMLVSITDREAVQIGNDISEFIERMPDWLRPEMKTNSKHEKQFTDTDSYIWFYTPAAVRSKSLSVLIIDEAAYIKDMDERWAGMYPALSGGGKGIVISTVNGTGNFFHDLYTKAEEKKNSFKVIDLHYNEHPEYSDKNWQLKTRMNVGERKWQREYEGNFFGSGDTFIEVKTIGEIQNRCREPVTKLLEEWDNTTIDQMTKEEAENENFVRGAMWVWEHPKQGREYLLSADSGEGQGSDYSTFQVLDMQSREQVAEFYSNTIKPYQFAQVIHQAGEFYNTALVVVENNGIGTATLTQLEHNLRYDNLYYTIEGNRQKAGLNTNSKTRSLFCNALQTCLYNDLVKINSVRIVRELDTYICNRSTGRPEAARNAHDDLISALMFGLYVLDIRERFMPIKDTTTTQTITSALNGKSLDTIRKKFLDDIDLEDFPEELEDLLYVDMTNRMKPPTDPKMAIIKEFGFDGS